MTTATPPSDHPQPPVRTLADFLPGDQYSEYLLTNRNEMFAVCRGLVDHVSLISMIFNGGRDIVLTTLIAYGENGLLFDFGASADTNDAALKADKLFCAGQLDKVEIQFILRGVRKMIVDGRPVFHAQLPESILRLQRREYFRLLTPIVNPLRCKLRIVDDSGNPLALSAQVVDISVGGVCLGGLPAGQGLETGQRFSNAEIAIAEGESLAATLELRWVTEVAVRGGRSSRAGFQFVGLPQAKSAQIQRYITRMERERKARETGQL
jgi:c-di-GMP-binding flagellar brake protein YcgR